MGVAVYGWGVMAQQDGSGKTSVKLSASVTRGNYYKLVPQHCKYDLRKHYFTNRLVPVWNSLPNNVVMAENINIFKNRLDKGIIQL